MKLLRFVFSHYFWMTLLLPLSVHAAQTSSSEATPRLSTLRLPTPPKLLLVLVYDQMRADQLIRHQDVMLPARSGKDRIGGFKYLMENSAYFPWASYETLQDMTCPGHATILTGSYPYTNGIPLNDFWDIKTNKSVYCVDDEEFGLSPRRLKGSTVGDQLKLTHPESKVIALSIKDRSGIMLGGKSADLALWLNEKNSWETSRYYTKNAELPAWLMELNKKTSAMNDTEVKFLNHKTKVGSIVSHGFPFAGQMTTDLAKNVLNEYKLGQHKYTDALIVSFSSNDVIGHHFGPDSNEIREITKTQDQQLSDLLNEIQQKVPGGLSQVLIALTADHGASPLAEYAQSAKIDSQRIDQEVVRSRLNQKLSDEFGALKMPYISSHRSFNFYFSSEAQAHKKFPEFLKRASELLRKEPGVALTFTLTEYQQQAWPRGLTGEQLKKSYVEQANGHLILIPEPFWYEVSKMPSTHVSGYAYDRTVPLIISGAHLKPGVYMEPTNVTDLAPTLSYLLGVLPPALNEGRVLHRALR